MSIQYNDSSDDEFPSTIKLDDLSSSEEENSVFGYPTKRKKQKLMLKDKQYSPNGKFQFITGFWIVELKIPCLLLIKLYTFIVQYIGSKLQNQL